VSKEVQKKPIIVAQIMGKWVGGGVESVIMNYYRHLDHSKIQFDFICDEDSTRIPYDEIKKLGGRVFLVPKYQNLPKYLKALEKLFKENQYRIVHSNINTLSVFPLYAAKKAGVPIRISHSHSTSNPKEWKRNLIKNILRPFSKRYATDYFACSEKTGIYQFGKRKSKLVKIIPNSIDIEIFKFHPKDRQDIRAELGIEEDTIVIGHIGRFVETKNHQFIIHSFSKLHQKNPNTKLILIGDGPLLEKTRKTVRDLGLEESVLFLGRKENIAPYYSVFDIFFLPSLYEGMPMSGIEAQVSGLKCIFSSSFSKDTAIIPGNVLFLSNEDKESLIKGVEYFNNQINNREVPLKEIEKVDIEKNTPILQSMYNKKTKIMHLVSTDSFSGAENVACQIINLFKDESSYDMRYCAVIGKNKEALEIRKIPVLKLDKFNIHDIKKAIREYNPDIIHAHDPKSTIASVIASRGKKIIAHIHSNHRYMRKISIKSCIFHFYIEKRTSDIIWVSDSALNEYIFNKKINKKINSIVLRNVVNPNELKDIAINDKNKYSFDLVFLGRMEDVKNPLRFIDIMSQIQKNKRDIKVAMIGDGSLMNEIKTKVNELGLEKNITIFGNLINPYKILLSSKILVITSRYEGTPMNALESIACGIPIVSTPVDGLLELLDKRYLCSSDDEFISVIIDLLTSKKNIMGYRNRLIAVDSSINDVSKYKKILEQLYNRETYESK